MPCVHPQNQRKNGTGRREYFENDTTKYFKALKGEDRAAQAETKGRRRLLVEVEIVYGTHGGLRLDLEGNQAKPQSKSARLLKRQNPTKKASGIWNQIYSNLFKKKATASAKAVESHPAAIGQVYTKENEDRLSVIQLNGPLGQGLLEFNIQREIKNELIIKMKLEMAKKVKKSKRPKNVL